MNGGVPGADIKFEDGLWCVRACQSFRVRLRPVLVARAFLRVKNVACLSQCRLCSRSRLSLGDGTLRC